MIAIQTENLVLTLTQSAVKRHTEVVSHIRPTRRRPDRRRPDVEPAVASGVGAKTLVPAKHSLWEMRTNQLFLMKGVIVLVLLRRRILRHPSPFLTKLKFLIAVLEAIVGTCL